MTIEEAKKLLHEAFEKLQKVQDELKIKFSTQDEFFEQLACAMTRLVTNNMRHGVGLQNTEAP